MEAFGILLVLALVVVVFVLPIAAFVRSGRAAREAEQLSARITALQIELARLRFSLEQQVAALQTAVESTVSPAGPQSEPGSAVQPLATLTPENGHRPAEAIALEPGPAMPVPPIAEVQPALPQTWIAPPSPPVLPPPIPPVSARQPAFNFDQLKGSLNWEQFMGAKLF